LCPISPRKAAISKSRPSCESQPKKRFNDDEAPEEMGSRRERQPCGCPAGAKNRLQGDFLHALAEDFREHGADVIGIARCEKPVEYLKIVASLMPKELLLTQDSALTDLTDEQLESALAKVLSEKAERAITMIPDGEVIQ
jgi:hypothetical protein